MRLVHHGVGAKDCSFITESEKKKEVIEVADSGLIETVCECALKVLNVNVPVCKN